MRLSDYIAALKYAGSDLVFRAAAPTSSDLMPAGSLWVDTSGKTMYQNTGTAASPTWTKFSALDSTIGTTELEDGAVTTDKLAAQAVELSKFSRGDTAGKFLVAQGSGSDAQWGTMSGDGTLDGSASFTLNNRLIQTVNVQLTAAQIKALATTPIELVAAQGAGTVIQFLGAELKLGYGSEVFAEAADNLGIKYTDAAGVQVSDTIETTGFIDQTADTYTSAVPVKDAIVAATAAENQALVLDNLNANFTGNASNDGTLDVTVAYKVVTIA